MNVRRPHRVTFEKRSVTQDAYSGHDIETWTPHFDEMAAIFYGTGTEQRAAAQLQGEQTASFEVLSNSRTRELTIADYRIVERGAAWNIRALSDMGFNDGVKVTAVRAVP